MSTGVSSGLGILTASILVSTLHFLGIGGWVSLKTAVSNVSLKPAGFKLDTVACNQSVRGRQGHR